MTRKSKGILVLLTLWLSLNGFGLPGTLWADSGKDSDSTAHKNHWNFKLAPLASFNGNFPFFVERQLSKSLAIEFAPGITSKDIFYEIGRSAREGSNINSTQADPGYSAYLGLRYYFSKYYESLQGGYFSPNIEYRYYHALVNPCNPFNQPNNQAFYLPETRRQAYFRISMGYQIISPGGFIFDMYGGIGIRGINSDLVTCDLIPGNGMRPGTHNRQTISPTMHIGLRFGFGI